MCNNRSCLECGTPLDGMDYRARFCSTACRKTFGNRRMTRGAELYDLFMAYRYDRGLAKALGFWSLICRMASIWREEDKEAGRASYGDPREAKERALRYTGTRSFNRF